MNGETLWNHVTSVLSSSGVEIQTTTGLWFTASSRDGRLYVDRAIYNSPSSELSMKRAISKKDFLFVHSYYDRWVNGEVGVRHDVSRKSRNTAYIFALLDKYVKIWVSHYLLVKIHILRKQRDYSFNNLFSRMEKLLHCRKLKETR